MSSIAEQTSSADGVAWNLADLYARPDDPRIAADLDAAERRAVAFEQGVSRQDRGRGRPGARVIARPRSSSSKPLSEQMDRSGIYASLLHAAKTDDPKHGALLAMTRRAAGPRSANT